MVHVEIKIGMDVSNILMLLYGMLYASDHLIFIKYERR